VRVVLGLGNPSKKYERTRHNLGFLVVDRVALEIGIAVKEKKYHSLIGSWKVNGEKVLLVKPQTYMNHSGEAAWNLLRYLPVEVKDLVVIHDDLDLPFGRIRIRNRGSAAGHRGVLSIIELLGDEGFFRVRMGIGRPPAGVDPTDYVLQTFSPEEVAQLEPIVSKAADGVESLLREGPHRAMGKFNRAE